MANKCYKTATSYKNGCRCDDCRLANRIYSREQKRKKYRPDSTWVPLKRVDPEETQAHLKWLEDNGIGVVTVHRETGVDMNTIIDIRKGRKSFLMSSTAERILAVGLHRVPSIDQVRDHVECLLKNGWTQRQIARAAGVSEYAIYELHGRKRQKCWPKTAERVLGVKL